MWRKLAAPWQTAVAQAIEALRAGSLAIGAAVCLSDGTPLCAGRNRLFEPPGSGGIVSGSTVAHAEVNALVALSLCSAHASRTNLSLYSTAEPCPMCIGAVAMSRVKHIHFASRDTWAGSADLVDKSPFLRRKVLSVTGPSDEGLEAVLIALHGYSHIRRHADGGPDAVLDRWSLFCPTGVALAERIRRDSRLQRLVLSDGTPEEVIDGLAGMAGLTGPVGDRSASRRPAMETGPCCRSHYGGPHAGPRAQGVDTMTDQIEVVAYDPAWPGLFADLGLALRQGLGVTAVRIDHIGSTSVSGLDAKPIIDVQVSVASFDPLGAICAAMEKIGFRHIPDNPDRSKRYFRELPGARRTHIHFRRVGSWPEQFALLFRDYMRSHAADRDDYARLKHELAARFRFDRGGYVDAKVPFIWGVMRKADAWSQEIGWAPGPTDA